MIEIPVPLDTPSSLLRTTLDGAVYVLHLEYQVRSGWYLGVSTAAEEPLLSLRRLAVWSDVFRGVVGPGVPTGRLVLVDLTGGFAEASFEDLGRRHKLFYFTAAEIEELQQ